jgi:preprotein translocase subunit YajC
LAATFELQPQDNQDQAEQLLVNFLEAGAQAVMAAGGIVGHIKATIGHDMLVTSFSTTGGGVNITRPKEVSAAATTRQTAATNRKSGTTPAEHNAPEQSLPPTINVAIIVLMLPKSNLREIIYENLLGTLCPAPLAD